MLSTAIASTQVPADQHVFLIGRPPLGEFVGFLKNQTIEGQTADVPELADQWRTANDRIRQLEQTETGAADNPRTSDLPASLGALGDKVLTDPLIRRSYGLTRTEIQVVELDTLVVFQKHINLEYTGELAQVLGDDPSETDIFNFCLPIDRRYDPPTRVGPISGGPAGPNAWAMLSPSTDYRVLETTLLDPSQVSGLTPTGMPTQIVAAVIGYGPNFASAMRVGNRLIAKNASHRLYALRAAGHTHAPVLIENLERDEEQEMMLPPDVQARRELYLSHPRPPLLRDYFDDELRMIVHVPRTTRQIRIGINYEEGYAPGA